MPTIYKYFKEKTSSILKSVFILAWRQGLRVLHLESRQLLNTCQSTLWFIPWLFFFFLPSLTFFPTASPLFLALSLPSLSILAKLWPSCFLCLQTLLWQLFWGLWQLGPHCVLRPAPASAHGWNLWNVFQTTCSVWDRRTILDLALDLGRSPEGTGNRGGSLL